MKLTTNSDNFQQLNGIILPSSDILVKICAITLALASVAFIAFLIFYSDGKKK